jgi:N-formylglutamate amidohydrolase
VAAKRYRASRPATFEGKSQGGRWNDFEGGGDFNTDILAQGIAAEIKALTGKKVYLVMAKFQRNFIDLNRPPEIALDSAAARPYYDYYHGSIRRLINEIRTNFPAGLLIDVHGQHDDPDVLMRGTQNGRTITRLLGRAGAPAITGPKGIFGQLETNGFKVFPANNLPVGGKSEDGGKNGGYSVVIYGSNAPNGIDAIQFEFGAKYRQKGALDKSAQDVAKAIVAFYEAYLKNLRTRSQNQGKGDNQRSVKALANRFGDH